MTAGFLLALLAGSAPVEAQFFPTEPPVEVFTDDFSTYVAPPAPADPWTIVRWSGGNGFDGNWRPNSYIYNCASGDTWLQHVRENDGQSDRSSVLTINQSLPGHPSYEPAQWENVSVEFDFRVNNDRSALGVVLGGTTWDNPVGNMIDVEEGYLFYMDQFPTKADARDRGERSVWHIVKRLNGTDTEIGRGVIELDPLNNNLLSVYEDQCYRLRVDFFCGNLRVMVKRFDCNSSDDCSYWQCGGTWCTIVEWTDTSGNVLTDGGGFVGLWSGGTLPGSDGSVRFDNVTSSAWETNCHQICEEWTQFTADWDDSPLTGLNGEEGRERFPFKRMYEGGLLDYSYGAAAPDFKIDLDVLMPDENDPRNITNPHDGYCDGWKLQVDLPPPGVPVDMTEVQSVLEPMSSAVDLVNDSGTFSWQDDFDPDPNSASYNPIPIVTDGATPIANTLWDAYDWYQTTITTPPWSIDPLSACRQWYVVLITDGEESCGLNACNGDQAAWKFKNPDTGEPVQIFTIGFSDAFDPLNPSPLECVSQITDGSFYVATDAAQLTSALVEVINQLDTRDRSFVPFQVTPPPSTAGSVAEPYDLLALAPYFVPKSDESLWAGNLFGFLFNASQPTLPVDADCQIDFTQVVWDAETSLSAQLAQATPARDVYMGMGSTRYRLEDVGTNPVLRDDFRVRLDMPTLPTNLEAQEIANFIRNIYANPMGLDPAPQNPPRPVAYSILGDIYHSQPAVVRPPNTSMFYYDYGFVGQSEVGAHDYQLFMDEHAKRRRVAVVGANDGMLHAFDAGFYDRDDGGTYDNQHDLGNGTELFGFVPDAVMERLWLMTYGIEQQYMVDGHIVISDVFISPDGVSPKEWRSVALASMRRGGRGIVALDLTQPDPTTGSDNMPAYTQMAGCADGTVGNCSAEYPELMWEFSDTGDADANGQPDLGWTWSRPAIARIAVYNALSPNQPDDVFIAFFGGGWDKNEVDETGTYVYGVDIETGNIVYKQAMGVAVPGSFAAHDSDIDGFHDRIYFGDSNGSLWRIGFPPPNDSGATGISGAILTRIYDFRGFTDRQEFFMRPILVPAGFDGRNFTWALALGSGDRANLQEEDMAISTFFFVLDTGQSTALTEANLLATDYSALTGDFQCADNALDPDNGLWGWYMTMRPNEKTTFEATVINGHVLFPTFEPGEGLLAQDPPDLCGTGGGGGGGGGFGGPDPPGGTPEDQLVCRAAGVGRVYDLWFACGNGSATELNDLPTGSEFYTIDGTTYVTHTLSGGSPGLTHEFINPTGYTVTNWRQE